MKLKFLKQEYLDTLKENISVNSKFYLNENNNWIYDFFNGEDPFLEFKDEVNDFEMDMSSETPTKTDFNNIKIVYENLKFLTESQASDERFWAGLCHDKFYNYMRYRWGNRIINKNNSHDKEVTRIGRAYFYEGVTAGKRKSLARNGLSRLWWIGRLTYDESYNDPFELTKLITFDISVSILYLMSSKFTKNDITRKGMLKALLEYKNSGKKVDKKVLNYLIKSLNILGGSYLLDFYGEEEIKEKCLKILYKMDSKR